MTFEDYDVLVDIDGRPTQVRVSADALHLFWGAESGPQDAAGLVAANMATVRAIASDKMAARDLEDERAIVRAMDIEG